MNRKQLRQFYAFVPWGKADDCPCCSGYKYGRCCGIKGGWPSVDIPPFLPKPKQNGTSHDDCYLASFGDCGGTISREHYVSESILEVIGELEVGGLPWVEKGKTVRLPTNALAVNVLCQDHNSAYHTLDDLGLRNFLNLKNATTEIIKFSISSKVSHTLMSGSAMEFWGLKCLMGMYYGKVASEERQRLREIRAMDIDLLRDIMTTRKFPPNCGLYVRTRPAMPQTDLGIGPISTETKVVGIRIRWFYVEFEIIFDPTGVNFDAVRMEAEFRPRMLRLECQSRKTYIVMTYLEPTDPVQFITSGRQVIATVPPQMVVG